MVTFEHKKM